MFRDVCLVCHVYMTCMSCMNVCLYDVKDCVGGLWTYMVPWYYTLKIKNKYISKSKYNLFLSNPSVHFYFILISYCIHIGQVYCKLIKVST